MGYNFAKFSRKKKELSKESEKTQGNRGGFGKESAFIGVSHWKGSPRPCPEIGICSGLKTRWSVSTNKTQRR
jgi:hypothetical protein